MSLEFSRQEYWRGSPVPTPVHESEVAQSCPTPRDTMDCSLPGSSVHGMFQARVLEWAAIAFSEFTHLLVANVWGGTSQKSASNKGGMPVILAG